MEHFIYMNISTKEEVRDVDAIDFVAEKCGFEMVNKTPMSKEFIDDTVEWFFSGNWIKIEDDTDYGVQANFTITSQVNITSNDVVDMVSSILGVRK